MLRALGLLILTALCWLAPGVAWAQPGRLAVTLRGADSALPGYACVVYYRREASRPRGVPAMRIGQPGEPGMARRRLEQLIEDPKRAEDDEVRATTDQVAGPVVALDDLRVALARVARRGQAEGDEPDRCAAKELKPKLTSGDYWVQCAMNEVEARATNRALIVSLSLPYASIDVFAVRLQGAELSVHLSAPAPTGAAFLTVIGGEYEVGSSTHNDASVMSLETLPLCEDRDLEIPVDLAQGRDATVTYREGAAAPLVFRGLGDAGRRVRVRLPRRSEPGEVKSVSVEVADRAVGSTESAGHERADVVYRGRHQWRERELPVSLMPLEVRRVRFHWRADPCLYAIHDVTDCPDVRASSGTVCRAVAVSDGQDPRCTYVCPPREEHGTVNLPMELRFTVGTQRDAWTDELAAPDQVLSAYADRDHRQFGVSFASWAGTSWAVPRFGASRGRTGERSTSVGPVGDKIDYVELRSATGVPHRIVPADGQRVTIPGVACGDLVAFEIVGSRRHQVGYARLRDGMVVLPSPGETAREFSFGAILGGGAVYDTEFAVFRPAARVGAAARFEPKGPWRPLSLGFEGQVSYQVSTIGYDGLSKVVQPLDGAHPGLDTTGYGRLALGVAADTALLNSERWRIGLGVQFVVGETLLARDKNLPPGRNPMLGASAYVRYRVAHAFALEGALQTFGPQPVYTFLADVEGDAVRQVHRVWMLGLEGGLRFWL